MALGSSHSDVDSRFGERNRTRNHAPQILLPAGAVCRVANIIPLLGPIATVIVAALVAAIDSQWKLLGVLIFYFVYQQIENAFLSPRIMQSQVQLPPSAVVIALLIGGELAGTIGAFVAVPTAVLCSVLIDEYLVHRTNE